MTDAQQEQTNLSKYENDLKKLLALGWKLIESLAGEEKKTRGVETKKNDATDVLDASFLRTKYQKWYTESLAVIKQLMPERLAEFEQYYCRPKRREIDHESYTISDYLMGLVVTRGVREINGLVAAGTKLLIQYRILESLQTRFKSTLFDIRQMVQADLFDSEIDVSKELLHHGFLRAAGAIAGVVLERHLRQVCDTHNAKPKRAKPTLADYNQCLIDSNVVEQPTWQFIQYLTGLRNLCDHDKEREPKKEEVMDLIQGTTKIIKTVF